MKISLHPDHQRHVQDIGIPEPPSELEVTAEEHEAAMKVWESTGFRGEDLRTKVAGHLAWKHHHKAKAIAEAKKPRNWERWYLVTIGILLIIVLLSVPAHCQFSKIKTITVTDGSTTLLTAAPFTITFSGCTVGGTGSAWTITCAGGPGGSGTVTSFSAGNLSPLFTSSVATATTTPALTFALTNSAAHTVFGNNTAGSAAPAYFVPAFTDLSGSLACGQLPALTTDVVTSGCAATIQANAVTQGKVTNGYVDLSTGQTVGGIKAFTGANTHSGSESFSGAATTIDNLNGLYVVGGTTYATTLSAITACNGSANGGIIWIPTTYAGVDSGSPTDGKCTIQDFRTGNIHANNNAVTWNTLTATPVRTFQRNYWHFASPTTSNTSMFGQAVYEGTLPNSMALEASTCETDLNLVANSPTATTVIGCEADVVLDSTTGNTVPDVRVIYARPNSTAINTTGVTNAFTGYFGAYTKAGSETVANAYTMYLEDPGAVATTNNWSLVAVGKSRFDKNATFDSVTTGIAQAAFQGDSTQVTPISLQDTHSGGHSWAIGEQFAVAQLQFRDTTQTGGPMWGLAVTGTGSNAGTLSHAVTANRTWTFPDATGTAALLELAQTWSALQTFTAGIKTGSGPPACTAGTAGFMCNTEGTAFTNVASTAGLYADSTTHEYMAKTNGASGAGMMVRVQPSAINNTAKTAAVTTATLCAASAGSCNTAGQYRLTYNVWGSGTACATVTAGSVVLNFTWTDENAVTHTTINAPMWDQKTAAMTSGQVNFNTALGTEGGSGSFVISTNGTIIQYATTYTACTSGTGTYNVRIAVERLQ